MLSIMKKWWASAKNPAPWELQSLKQTPNLFESHCASEGTRREDSQFTNRTADPLSSLFPKRKVWIAFQSLKSFELFLGLAHKIKQWALIDHLHVKSPSNKTTKQLLELWRSRFSLLHNLQKNTFQPFIDYIQGIGNEKNTFIWIWTFQ